MPAQQLVESFLHHFIKPAQQLHRKLLQLRFRLPHGFRLRRRLCGRSCTAGHSFFGRFRRRGLHRHFRTGRRRAACCSAFSARATAICSSSGPAHRPLRGRHFPAAERSSGARRQTAGSGSGDLGVGRFQLAGQLLQFVAALCPHRCCGLRRRLWAKRCRRALFSCLSCAMVSSIPCCVCRARRSSAAYAARMCAIQFFNIQFPVPRTIGPQRNVLFQHCIASLRLRARDPPLLTGAVPRCVYYLPALLPLVQDGQQLVVVTVVAAFLSTGFAAAAGAAGAAAGAAGAAGAAAVAALPVSLLNTADGTDWAPPMRC